MCGVAILMQIVQTYTHMRRSQTCPSAIFTHDFEISTLTSSTDRACVTSNVYFQYGHYIQGIVYLVAQNTPS